MNAHRLRIIFSAICILSVIAVSGWFLLSPPPQILQGEVDAREISVSSKLAGRVTTLHVKEGMTVSEGQLLVTIQSPEIEAKLEQATAAQKAATAQKEKAFSGAREEQIRAAKNAWQTAQAAADLAEKTYTRLKRLNDDGVIPAQQLDEGFAKRTAALKMAEAARATYDMALAGAQKEDREAAAALADQATGAVNEVEAYLAETRLSAPISGEVAEVISEPGELISPGFPVMTLVDLSDVWVVFHIREDRMPRIRMGTRLPALFPAIGEKPVELAVSQIAVMADFATWHATKTSGDFDLKTFEVRARPVSPVNGLRPGMTAIVDWDQIPQPSTESNT